MVDQPPAPARRARAGRGADPWPEDLSPFRPIAKLAIEAQAFSDEAAMETCERATFSPWNALPEHRPLGGINRVRREIYEQMAAFRNAANDVN